jgi:hypothetical protein
MTIQRKGAEAQANGLRAATPRRVAHRGLARGGAWLLAAAVAASLVVACGESSGGAAETTEQPGELQVDLKARNDARVAGARAVLTYRSKTKTMVRVEGVDVSSPNARSSDTPATIVRGTCDDPGKKAYALEPIRGGASESTLDVGLPELLRQDYAIVVLFTDDNERQIVACGELPDEAPAS